VFGITLTLRNRDATVLLAFLTVLVGIAATRSWRIWRFALHSFLTWRTQKQTPSKAQRRLQVMLRNNETPASALLNFGSLPFMTDRIFNSRDKGNSLMLFVIALIHLAGFKAAAILTSQIVFGSEVTSKSLDSCGHWIARNATTSSTLNASAVMDLSFLAGQELQFNSTIDADNYVRNCYPQGVSREVLDCGTFMARSLPVYTMNNVSCPFDSSICLNGTNSAFQIDSGNITMAALGLNIKHATKLSIQRRSVCAPIKIQPFLDNYQDSRNLSTLSQDEIIVKYSFYKYEGKNFTYLYRFDNYSPGYDLRAAPIVSMIQDVAEPLQPRPNDTTISLMLLSAPNMVFLQPSDDPWFAAHDPLNSTSVPFYSMDYAVNVLACDERARFCSDITQRCQEWNSLASFDEPVDLATLGGDAVKDFESIEAIYLMTSIMRLHLGSNFLAYSIQNRKAAALQAGRYATNTIQYKLQPEQWKVELSYWFSMALARLQLDVFGTIEKPPGVDPAVAINQWKSNKDLQWMCGRIKFRSAAHTSLSAFGVFFVVTAVILLMVVSNMDVLLSLLCKRLAFVRQWVETDSLALLKMVEEFEEKEHVHTYEGEYISETSDNPNKP